MKGKTIFEKMHPEFSAVIENFPPLDFETRDGIWPGRPAYNAGLVMPPADQAVNVYDKMIDGPAGELRIRIYEPKEKTENAPTLLWIHGGGYMAGMPEQDEYISQIFAHQLGCVVVSPDYRLAPENPYPAALDDCYAVLLWIAEHGEALGSDVSNLGIGGQSSGGGLTAAVCLKARDFGGPEIKFQMPLYPMIDCRMESKSVNELHDDRIWNTKANTYAWTAYLGEDFRNVTDPYASAALARDFSELPPAYMLVGGLDPFRDETIEYAHNMMKAGVDVELHVYPASPHAFEMTVPGAYSDYVINEYVQALGRAFRGS